jgi:hypothetical protein
VTLASQRFSFSFILSLYWLIDLSIYLSSVYLSDESSHPLSSLLLPLLAPIIHSGHNCPHFLLASIVLLSTVVNSQTWVSTSDVFHFQSHFSTCHKDKQNVAQSAY